MAIYEAMQCQKNTLDGLYIDNLETVLSLRRTLIEDVLPDLQDEFTLDPWQEKVSREWVEDISSVFRMLKRHIFVASFALESIRELLLWRLTALSRHLDRIPPFIQCLPTTASDPFGRPILVVKLVEASDMCEESKHMVVDCLELLRAHLAWLNAQRLEDSAALPVMQIPKLFVVCKSLIYAVAAGRSRNVVHARGYPVLPGYVGSRHGSEVFVFNYTWAHSGVWNLARRVLPSSALSRIFFPSQTELVDYFSPSQLPKEFGGLLPPLSELYDPLNGYLPPCPHDRSAAEIYESGGESPKPVHAASTSAASADMSPTSVSNPFYGYPVHYDTPIPTLRHGRRRKRDLIRMLVRLLWGRWKKHITVALIVFLLLIIPEILRRPWIRAGKWNRGLQLRSSLRLAFAALRADTA